MAGDLKEEASRGKVFYIDDEIDIFAIKKNMERKN